MSLLRMSIAGGALILAAVLVRALTLNRLPKRTFLVLWAVALLRLLVPFTAASALSVYALADRWAPPAQAAPPQEAAAPTPSPPVSEVLGNAAISGNTSPPPVPEGDFPVLPALWLAGALLCGGFFLTAYVRCRRAFRAALPVEDPEARRWLADHPLRRTVTLRQWDAAPLTYGVFRPVILLPGDADWSDAPRMAWVLEHELVHIRRLDALWKLFLAAAACIHWFNPLVWCMYVLANRDIELSCDEAVVRRFGLERRASYARTLISMEEQRSGLGPFSSAFSKNAIEERITAIMKTKKRSLAAVLAAAALVCCVSIAFATSAPQREDAGLREHLTAIPGGEFTEEESQRLFALWFQGYEDMTVADYQEKMWAEWDAPADVALIDRYAQSEGSYELPAGEEAEALAAFNDYFFQVYLPLTGDGWQNRSFSDGAAQRSAMVEYDCYLSVLDRNKLTVGEYQEARRAAEAAFRQLLEGYTTEELQDEERMNSALTQKIASLTASLSTGELRVSLQWVFQPMDPADEALHVQSSSETAAKWDRLLTPYVAFGLAYVFDDPDLDGNGLTMGFQGHEVRGIMDPLKGWITEHAGSGAYGPDAVELFAVYEGSTLTGLRLATPEEQAEFDRQRNAASGDQEEREFPNATRADYDSLLALRTADYQRLSLEEFNQRLLDWANEHQDAYDRIECDVIWSDCAVELTEEEWTFAALTCHQSGTENAMQIRSLHTGLPEEDPGFSANLPTWSRDVDGAVMAWCQLYYDISYHVSDKSVVTVGERDDCVSAMREAIQRFWWNTDLEDLLQLTEADVVDRFNTWAKTASRGGVTFHPVTADNIQFECMDERAGAGEQFATRADYDSLLALRTADYQRLSLEEFNQRLLDWADENPEACERVMSAAYLRSYAVDLTEEERAFLETTCWQSRQENVMQVRNSNPLFQDQRDPVFLGALPPRQEAMDQGRLYYEVSYHVGSPASVTVGERDAALAAMREAIGRFWRETDPDVLFQMTQEEAWAAYNALAEAHSTERIRFNPITADSVHERFSLGV